MNTNERALTVVVTGVGAIIGQGIVKSLRRSKHAVRIVGVDQNARPPGPSLVDVFEKKPSVDEADSAYLDFWARIIRSHGASLVLPGLEVDMLFLDGHRHFFAELGVTLALNTSELIKQATDKWSFGETLKRIGYGAIPSARPRSWREAIDVLGPPPLLLKPSHGNGSRGIVTLRDEDDFEYWTRKAAAGWMMQRIVGTAETEYTVGVFGLGNGEMVGPQIFRRQLSPAGNTLMAEVVLHHPMIESAVERLAAHFLPLGPTNFQFRVEDEHAYLLEINPRFSSSNSLRTAFGFNEAEMAVDFYHFGRRPATPKVTAGVGWRYTEDFVSHAGDLV